MIGTLTVFADTTFKVVKCSFDNKVNSFIGFPHWYEYLSGVKNATNGSPCVPQLRNITDVWLVVAAIIEILLRVASLAAIGFILYGGVKFILSQGEPDEVTKARDTIFNALIGLVIAVTAGVVVAFIAGKFHG